MSISKNIENLRLQACCRLLEKKNYSNVEIINTPTDLRAMKDNEEILIEVKWTSKSDYFGAATYTEWRPYCEGRPLKFLIVQGKEKDSTEIETGKLIDADEFIKYCTIPPYKVNFNIDISAPQKHQSHKYKVDKEVLYSYGLIFDIMKNPKQRKLLEDFIKNTFNK